MFCKNCGAQIADGAKFCGVCGASQAETAAPAAPAAPANPNSASASAGAAINLGSLAEKIKVYTKFILLGIVVFALILSIMNLFSTYDVKGTYSLGGQKVSESGPVKELFEKEFDGKFTMVLIGNILFGLVNLAIAAVSVLYFLKDNNNNDLYDKFVAKYTKGMNPLFLIGAAGAATALLQIICYAVCKMSMMGAKFTVAAHWTTWVALFLYAGCAVLDKFVLNKKQ